MFITELHKQTHYSPIRTRRSSKQICLLSDSFACNERQAFFTSGDTKRFRLWFCQNVCDALIYLLDNIYIRFGTKLYRQIVGIPMGTNCAPLVADLFLFCYERDFMTSLSGVKQVEIIEAFKSTSRYLDDLLNIDNPYFEGMVNRIYPPELQSNKANTSDTEAPFLDLHLSISNGFFSSKIYDKRDDFDFDIVNFPFLDGDVPRSTSYGVYISQLIRFARVSSHVVDFNARNKSLTAKLLQQGYRYHKLRKTFSKFYRRHYELVSSMFPLAFVAGWLQGHWWGFISRNHVVWPTFLLMNVFIALKGSHFWFLFDFTAAGVVQCGCRKTPPRTSTIVQFIFYFGPLRSAIIFWEIRNKWLVKTHILDRFLFIWTPFWFISIFESTAYLKFAKL